ncbi:hypothetical protein [Salinigranum sp.]|uniref:DUF7576 family protein n=1 Tax=Salinigranum sp. TaxID=1966351 RepID=UPI0035685EE0
MSDGTASFPEACDHCGTALEEEVRYPTATVSEDDGDVSIFTFCDEACKEGWLDDRSGDPR